MSRLYQIKLKQFEDCKKRLEKLEEEYEANSRQLGYDNDEVNRKRLRRKQETLGEEMEETAQQYDQLEQKLQELKSQEPIDAVSESLQELVRLLTPVSFDIVTKARQLCLPESRARQVPETLDALLGQLAEIPGEPDQPKPLLQFVSILLQGRSLKPDQRKALRAWAEMQGLTPVRSGNNELVKVQPKKVEACLMVKVQPRSLNDPSLGYLLSAAITIDSEPLDPKVELKPTAISISHAPDPNYAPGYSKDDLPHVLSDLINICGKNHALTELTVQWFLPIELMSLPIEHWQIRIGRSQGQCSGQRCKTVIVRSYDRHFLEHYRLATGDWEKYWTRLLDCSESRCRETLHLLDPMNGKTTIDWNNSKVVGCKFMEHDDQQQQADFWDHLLGQGLPIALWMRQPGTNQQMGKAMQAVAKCPIVQLPMSLSKQRHKALSQTSETDRLRNAPLCLLWDNPFRPFPIIDYQSA